MRVFAWSLVTYCSCQAIGNCTSKAVTRIVNVYIYIIYNHICIYNCYYIYIYISNVYIYIHINKYIYIYISNVYIIYIYIHINKYIYIYIYIYMGSVRFPGPPDLGVW